MNAKEQAFEEAQSLPSGVVSTDVELPRVGLSLSQPEPASVPLRSERAQRLQHLRRRKQDPHQKRVVSRLERQPLPALQLQRFAPVRVH